MTNEDRIAVIEEKMAILKEELRARYDRIDELRSETSCLEKQIESLNRESVALNNTRDMPEKEVAITDSEIAINEHGGTRNMPRMSRSKGGR